jgi:hypothetical protein
MSPTNIPLIAPIDVPQTMSKVSCSISAATTPASYAPRAPPPPRISARTGFRGTSLGLRFPNMPIIDARPPCSE